MLWKWDNTKCNLLGIQYNSLEIHPSRLFPFTDEQDSVKLTYHPLLTIRLLQDSLADSFFFFFPTVNKTTTMNTHVRFLCVSWSVCLLEKNSQTWGRMRGEQSQAWSPVPRSQGPTPPHRSKPEGGFLLQKGKTRDFPGGPVVKTLSLHGSGHRFDPWSGN